MNINLKNVSREQAIELAKSFPEVVGQLFDSVNTSTEKVVSILVKNTSNPEASKINLIKYCRAIAQELNGPEHYLASLTYAKTLVETKIAEFRRE